MVHTLDYSWDQLMRCQSRIQQGQHLRIIHLLNQDSPGAEDRYYVIIDCTPQQYTLLQML